MALPGIGEDSWISFAEETTYGTSPGSGWFYARLLDANPDTDVTPKPYPGMSRTQRAMYHAGRRVKLEVRPEFHFGGLGKIFKWAMGTYTYQADTPEVGANTHTFTIGTTLKSFSSELSVGNIPTGKVFLYEGCKINELGLKMAAEDWLDVALSIIAKDETPNTTASGTPSYPSNLPPLSHMVGTVTVADSTISIKDFMLTVARNLAGERFNMGQLIDEPVPTGVVVNGSVTSEFEDLTHYTKYLAGTEGSFSLDLTSDQKIGATNTNYKLSLSGSACHLTGETPKPSGPGIIDATFAFTLLGSSPLTLTLINGDSTYM